MIIGAVVVAVDTQMPGQGQALIRACMSGGAAIGSSQN